MSPALDSGGAGFEALFADAGGDAGAVVVEALGDCVQQATTSRTK